MRQNAAPHRWKVRNTLSGGARDKRDKELIVATNGSVTEASVGETTPYETAVLGFRNYWYPVFSSKEISRKPKGVTLLGDKVVFMRGKADGKVYALGDECPHRGTLLSSGRGCEFPGGDTITCPYHGWTYDLETDWCVAVLPEGPDSQVPGKARAKTYPVEEFKGIVWVWMGSMEPVPIRDDLPTILAKDDNFVKFRHKVVYGNWRWHAENLNAGHVQMVHRDAIVMWPKRPINSYLPGDPELKEDLDGLGVLPPPYGNPPKDAELDDGRKGKGQGWGIYFPGLGRWYVPPWWRRIAFWPWRLLRPGSQIGQAAGGTVQGASSSKLFLPGFFRQPDFPGVGDIYYEWYVPVDEEHYSYAQITCMWGKGPIHRLWKHIWYYLWTKPVCLTNFNGQDYAMVAQTTNYTKRHKLAIYPLTKISRHDAFHTMWRAYANEYARGVGYRYQDGQQPSTNSAETRESREVAISGGSED